jgi:hypothetical protein
MSVLEFSSLVAARCDAFVAFDRLSPCERYELLAPLHEPVRRAADLVLLGLHALDGVLYRSAHRPYHFYVHGDASVEHLLALAGLGGVAHGEALCLLTLAQLIYRFPCARKFDVADAAVKQLRINSWGRDYCERVAVPRYPDEHARLAATATAHIAERRAIYEPLLRALLSAGPDAALPEVPRWNHQLDIKVLS